MCWKKGKILLKLVFICCRMDLYTDVYPSIYLIYVQYVEILFYIFKARPPFSVNWRIVQFLFSLWARYVYAATNLLASQPLGRCLNFRVMVLWFFIFFITAPPKLRPAVYILHPTCFMRPALLCIKKKYRLPSW